MTSQFLRSRAAFLSLKRRLRWRLGYYLHTPKRRDVALQHERRNMTGCNTVELGKFVWFRLLPVVGVMPFPPHELMLMCAAVVCLRPNLVVEWGTHIGVSARVFWEANRRYHIGCTIHSIDLPERVRHFEHPGRMRGRLVRGRDVILHQGDGLEIACGIIRDSGDPEPLVFIDGDHAKATVLREATTLWTLFPRAAILFHDTFIDPTTPEANGPGEALHEVLNSIDRPAFTLEAGLGKPGMTLVVPHSAP